MITHASPKAPHSDLERSHALASALGFISARFPVAWKGMPWRPLGPPTIRLAPDGGTGWVRLRLAVEAANARAVGTWIGSYSRVGNDWELTFSACALEGGEGPRLPGCCSPV